MKAKQAGEKAQMEKEREKTRRRQEKLKNIILKEAEDNRAKKAAGIAVGPSEDLAGILAKKRKSASPVPDEDQEELDEEKKKQQMMMRRFYRNRHASFMKAMLEKNKSK